MIQKLFNIGRDPGLELGFLLDLRGLSWRVFRVVICIILLLEFLSLHLRKKILSR